MTPEEVQTLYRYNSWANHRALDASAALTPAQFTQHVVSSFPSVRDTLAHIMLSEWLWLERWHGRSPGFPADQFADLPSLRARWHEIENDLSAFIQKLSAADLDRVVEYKNTKGNAFSNPMRQMLQHVITHSAYHRGQVTTMLRQLGATPLTTDLMAFYREQVGRAHN